MDHATIIKITACRTSTGNIMEYECCSYDLQYVFKRLMVCRLYQEERKDLKAFLPGTWGCWAQKQENFPVGFRTGKIGSVIEGLALHYRQEHEGAFIVQHPGSEATVSNRAIQSAPPQTISHGLLVWYMKTVCSTKRFKQPLIHQIPALTPRPHRPSF